MTESPRPDYGKDGQSVSWSSHFNNLMNQLENLEKRIQQAGAPFWRVSRAKP